MKRYSLTQQVKDDTFNPSHLDRYFLLLGVGIRDVQVGVVNEKRHCIYIEDYQLHGVRTVSDRLGLLQALFQSHHFLSGGFWREARLMIKSHKFALMPKKIFSKQVAQQFLSLSAKLNDTYERAYGYLHRNLDVVNVFGADYRLISFIEEVYSGKKIHLFQQGSALIELGKQHYGSGGMHKSLYLLLDGNILHMLVYSMQGMEYYNQFSSSSMEELLRYIDMVNKELDLAQSRSPMIFFSSHMQRIGGFISALQQRYSDRVEIGKRPSFLSYGDVFDKIPSYAYADLLAGCLCQQPVYQL